MKTKCKCESPLWTYEDSSGLRCKICNSFMLMTDAERILNDYFSYGIKYGLLSGQIKEHPLNDDGIDVPGMYEIDEEDLEQIEMMERYVQYYLDDLQLMQNEIDVLKAKVERYEIGAVQVAMWSHPNQSAGPVDSLEVIHSIANGLLKDLPVVVEDPKG